MPKAQYALQRYGHQVVIANDLNTRKYEVLFVQPDSKEGDWVRITDPQLKAGMEIEEKIVARLVDMHTRHIDAK